MLVVLNRNKLSSLIRKEVDKELFPLLENYRGFSIGTLKKFTNLRNIQKYIHKYLPYLNEGTARIVYGLGSGKIIKVSIIDDVIYNQNKKEFSVYTTPGAADFLAKIYDFDDKNYYWLVEEAVKIFQDNKTELSKFTPVEKLLSYIEDYANEYSSFDEVLKFCIEKRNEYYKNRIIKHALSNNYFDNGKRVELEDFNSFDISLFKNIYKAAKLGFEDIGRYDHWGYTMNGRMVLADYGF